MSLLTLPAWIAIGTTVESAYVDVPFEFRYTPGTWTIVGIRDENTWHDSHVRIECTTLNGTYISMWVVLETFLRDWRRAVTA